MRIGNILRKWRINEEMTTRQLGAQIGISASTVSRIECGESTDAATLLLLIHWLFGKEPQ